MKSMLLSVFLAFFFTIATHATPAKPTKMQKTLYQKYRSYLHKNPIKNFIYNSGLTILAHYCFKDVLEYFDLNEAAIDCEDPLDKNFRLNMFYASDLCTITFFMATMLHELYSTSNAYQKQLLINTKLLETIKKHKK